MRAFVFVLALACATSACASGYVGSARDFAPATFAREPGWLVVRDVPFLAQRAESDCGAAAIAMLVGYWTGAAPAELAEALRPAPERGLKAGVLRDFAGRHGLAAFLVRGEPADLVHELSRGRPVLVGLVKPQRKGAVTHYELVVALNERRGIVVTLDPAEGWRQNSWAGFLAEWQPAGHLALVVSTVANEARR